MRSVHLIVPDLFLSADIAPAMTQGLVLPALERMVARGRRVGDVAAMGLSLEEALCAAFLVPQSGRTPVAALSAAYDGLGAGCWLRADPASMQVTRSELLLQPLDDVSAEEGAALCAALDAHFAGQGVAFFAPQPARWYLRLDAQPDIVTVPLSQAAGRAVGHALPSGEEGADWQRLFNEMQMLLFSHPVNVAREARGALPVNALWLWGNGEPQLRSPGRYASVGADGELAAIFAAAAGVRFRDAAAGWGDAGVGGEHLVVWGGLRERLSRGDLDGWRSALQAFEHSHLQPLWRALRSGEIARLRLDVLGAAGVSLELTRADAWALWRRPRPLAAGLPV